MDIVNVAVKFHPNFRDKFLQLKLTYNIRNVFSNLWSYNLCTVMAWCFKNEQLFAVIKPLIRPYSAKQFF